ncbi:MAG: carbohydrate ABC transporter permease [Clostridia bacterium]|nr:carbohydrate ABC transporter permease [Clostridia bacterium]
MKTTKSKKKINVVNVIFITVLCTILVAYTVSLLYMLFWGLLTSLKSNTDFLHMKNVLGFPNLEKSREEFLHFANYKLNLEYFEFTKKAIYFSGDKQIIHKSTSGIFDMLIYTVLYAGLGTVLHAVATATVAYLCVKYKHFRLSKIVYGANIVCMTLPLVGTAPATIEILRNLNIFDSFVGMSMMKFSFTGMHFLVLYAFFEGVSDSYSEAAEIDGASYYRIYFSIMLPLAIKVLSTTMLLQFVTLWNDYQTPLLYLPTYPTLAYGVYYMSTVSIGQLSKTPARIAASMMLAIPIFILFIFLRNKLMGNISIGGVKE